MKNRSKFSFVLMLMGCVLTDAYAKTGAGNIYSNGAMWSAARTEEHTVKGVITDEKGEPLIGVSVAVPGSTQGTVTDIDGNYTITLPSGVTQLMYSYIGYKPQTVLIENKTVLNIVLKEDTQLLDEVVVTAMGIERESKSLTYATQTIKSEELTRIKEPNFINSLQGKSAGLIITPNNSGAGGGATKIILRGQSSILGTNQPLIVLDGVPMSGGMGSQATELMQGAQRDGGDILSTLNPDDIASMTILKGPNAAALYGSSANNGVIIITTKSGEKGKAEINISSSTSVESLFMYPKAQTVFGLSGNELAAWGLPISGMTSDDLASQPYLTASPRDAVKDFFKLGLTANNGVTISGGTENHRSYFSYGNTTQTGIMPGNKFYKHNVMLKETFSLFDKRLETTVGLNYIHQKVENRPVSGRVLSPLHALYRMPSNVDIRYFKNHYRHTGTMNDYMVSNLENGNRKLLGQLIQTWDWFEQHLNNPYWLTNMHHDERTKNRILGNLSARVKIWRNLDFQTRLNVDVNLDKGLNTEYATSMRESQGKGGQYWSNNANSSDIFNDYMLTVNEKINDDISVNAAVGTSFSRNFNRSTSITTVIDTSGVANAFVPQNSNYIRPNNPSGSATSAFDSYNNSDWNSAVFATASVNLWDKVFLDGSYRREWARSFQQFSRSNKYLSFGYYSVGANMLLDKLFHLEYTWLNQLKLRGSYSVVGNPVPNELFSRQTINFHTGVISPRPPVFDDPKPETTTSYETGLDVWLFENKLNFDVTYYNSTLENQFMRIATASGEQKPVNTGKIRNYGVEFSINYRWAINSDWLWSTGFNIAYNDNRILKTYKQADGTPYMVTMGPSAFKIKYVEGGAFGDIYVNSFKRNKDGSIVVNNAGNYENAVPQMASGSYSTFVGNTTAKTNFGWNNTLTWKNFTLYMLIDGKIGGKVMSLTEPERDYYGISGRSAHDRLHGQRVTQNDKEYTLKELPDGQKVSVENYYKTVGANPMENYVYDASNIRLRDISLGYVFRNLFGSGKDFSLSFVMKNVCFIYKKAPVDPDISVSAANGFSGIDSYSLPTTRTYGLNLRATF